MLLCYMLVLLFLMLKGEPAVSGFSMKSCDRAEITDEFNTRGLWVK